MIIHQSKTNLGRIQRFFHSTGKCKVVYYWAGSLHTEPELFTLSITPNTVIQEDDPVTVTERQVLLMRETDLSNFTFDIINTNALPELVCHNKNALATEEPLAAAGSSAGVEGTAHLLICPVCNIKIPASIIETHAEIYNRFSY